MGGLPGINELMILMLLITVLSMTGLWPRIIQGLRELRGERFDAPEGPAKETDMCFKILGLSPSASWTEIEKAYRQKARIHHPDRGGDEDTMRALNEAYSRLKEVFRN